MLLEFILLGLVGGTIVGISLRLFDLYRYKNLDKIQD